MFSQNFLIQLHLFPNHVKIFIYKKNNCQGLEIHLKDHVSLNHG